MSDPTRLWCQLVPLSKKEIRYKSDGGRSAACKDGVFSNSLIHHEFDMSHNQSLSPTTSKSFSRYQLGYKFDELRSSERKNLTYRLELKLEGRGAYHLDGILSFSLMLKSHCEMAPTRSTSLHAVATNTAEPILNNPFLDNALQVLSQLSDDVGKELSFISPTFTLLKVIMDIKQSSRCRRQV